MSYNNNWMLSNFLSLNPSKTEFLFIVLPKQLEKLNHPSIHLPQDLVLSPVDTARNLGVIFNSNLTFFIIPNSAVSKSCLDHIRHLRRIHNSIDRTTASNYSNLSCSLNLTTAI